MQTNGYSPPACVIHLSDTVFQLVALTFVFSGCFALISAAFLLLGSVLSLSRCIKSFEGCQLADDVKKITTAT